MKYDFETINLIAQAINEHALVRPYDWIILAVAVFTFIASIIVAIFSYKLNQKQSEILKEQNKISLFKERLRSYNLYKQLFKNIEKLSQQLTNRSVATTYNKREFAILLSNLFYKLSEPVSKLLTHQPEMVIEQNLNKFAELEEQLDMIDYLFVLDETASNQVKELRKSLKELRDCINRSEELLEIDKKLQSVLAIINDDTLKNKMKEHLYISKKGD